MAEKTILRDETKADVRKPRMYRVILINDDYTTMDFVVEVIVCVFHKTASEATKIMMDVHERGRGIVGVYTYDIASTKIAEVHTLAKERNFPLKATMEGE